MKSNQTEKFRKSENFPVASFLIPKRSRNAIRALYVFARNSDEIADASAQANERRIQELTKIQEHLVEGNDNGLPPFARAFLKYCKAGFMDKKHGVLLLDAFIQDNQKSRYNDWDETIGYCQKSAATIGRLFLEATNEFDAEIAKADNICNVLQLLNHLQDLKSDLQKNDRIYFDKSFFPDEPEILESTENDQITHGKNLVLDKLETLISESEDFTKDIHSFKVRVELNTIVNVTKTLSEAIRKKDILKRRVELSKLQKTSCLVKAFLKSMFQKSEESKSLSISKGSKSSFFRPLLSLDKQKMQDMLCFYAFCRKVDDAADAEDSSITKIGFWQSELDKIYSPYPSQYPLGSVSRQLNLIVRRYNIPKNYLEEIIKGQVIDLENKLIFPIMQEYEDYCYKVASSVGLASVKIFGFHNENESEINKFAEYLGKYFQTINIMRDIEEDLSRERVYIPLELWNNVFSGEQANIENLKRKIQHKDLNPLYFELDNLAQNYKAMAFDNLPEEDLKTMKSALLMDKVYSKYLEKMKMMDFDFEREDLTLSFLEKVKIFH